VQAVKRGRLAVTVCSKAFVTLGRAQASALGGAGLPIAVVPHPFGSRSREEIRTIAATCAAEIAALISGGKS
jgi:hypothetical protein